MQNGHEVLYSGDDAMGRMEDEMGEGGIYFDSNRTPISRTCAFKLSITVAIRKKGRGKLNSNCRNICTSP